MICKLLSSWGVRVFLLLIIPVLPLLAQQDADQMFKKYSSREGLLNNGIYSLARSKNGLWWIGTGIGLQRFDGYNFETWNQSSDSSAQSLLGAQNVFEDSEGNVWVFNFNRHYVFPSGSKKFELVTLDSAKAVSYPGVFPFPLMETSEIIWCFESNTGLYGINKQNHKIDTTIQISFNSKQSDYLTAAAPFIGLDENGSAWITQDYPDLNYIICFSPDKEIKRFTLPVAKYGRIKGYIPIGKNEFLFISTTYTAIYRGTDFETPIKILSRENIPGNYIRGLPYERLKINNTGSILFPGNDGLYLFDIVTQTVKPYATSVYPDINLTRQLMFALKEDERGNLWIGRDGSDGLLVFYPGKLKFSFLKAPTSYFNLVYSLAVDENDRVFASNFQKGLNVFNPEGKWIKYIDLPKTEHGLSPSIRTLGFIDKNHLAMKSLHETLLILDTHDFSIRDIGHLLPARIVALKNNFDANFYKVQENELHFTHGSYLLSLIKEGENYSIEVIDSIMSENRLTSITYSKKNKPLLGTGNGCYVKENKQWVRIAGTEKFNIKFITVADDGLVWAATSRGILVINGNKLQTIYDEANGLLNEFTYGILFDENGNAWYSSNRGLGCIHKNGSISFFTEADGLQGDEFDTQSFWKGVDGKLYFGGINGITSFYPREVLQPVDAGKIVLSGIHVNGDTYPEQGRVDDVSALELPYHQNALTFHFTLSDFSDVAYNVYQVKMDGFDHDWINIRNTHSIRYQLSPGHYQLHLKGSNDGSTWSEEHTMPITIHPAWWQTILFKWLATMTALGLFASGTWYYNRVRTSKLKQQLQLEHEMQKERERISRDLHDNIGAYSTALIANTDSLEQIIQDKEGKETVLYLKENAKNILSNIRETIWLLNSNNLTISGFTEGFINYCTNILRNYEGIEIEFKENIKENKTLSPTAAINLLRILQEIIQNIVKHSKANKISCYIESNESLTVTIMDNGKGFDTTVKNYGNGLKNMKVRATEINFIILFKSEPGNGTETTLTGKI